MRKPGRNVRFPSKAWRFFGFETRAYSFRPARLGEKLDCTVHFVTEPAKRFKAAVRERQVSIEMGIKNLLHSCRFPISYNL